MKGYILREFETLSYSTHTMFIATSMEIATKLCIKVADKLMSLEDNDENECLLDAFSCHLREYDEVSGKTKPYTWQQVIESLTRSLKEVELDALIHDKVVDGD
jgi:hypothetical protein